MRECEDNCCVSEPARPMMEKTSKQELLRNYEITITFLSIGCIVRVGCKQIPFQTVNEAIKALNDYVEDPEKETERWNKIFREI